MTDMPNTFPRLLLALMLAGLFTHQARADAQDSVTLSVGLAALYDNNLFRQPAGNEQSDTVTTASFTLGFNKAWSLQRLRANATLVDYRYQENDYLSYQAKNYDAAWNWSFTPRLHGVLSVDQVEQQNSFVDYSASTPAQRKNVRRTENQRFSLEWEAIAGWLALGGLSRVAQTNSQSFLEQSSYELNNLEFGGRYVWPAGNYLQIMQKRGEGEYKERRLISFAEVPAPFNSQIDTGFHQDETELKLYLPLTGKSSVSGRLARQERRHDHFPDRDYAATVGRLDYAWQPTGKLSLNAGLRRDVAAFQNYASSYYLADGLTLQPLWQITARTALRLRYDWEKRRYEGGIFPGLAERRDKLQSARLSVEWMPANWSTLSLGLQQDRRNSSQDAWDYKANSLNLNAQFMF